MWKLTGQTPDGREEPSGVRHGMTSWRWEFKGVCKNKYMALISIYKLWKGWNGEDYT